MAKNKKRKFGKIQKCACAERSEAGVAQLVERLVANEKVAGSNPVSRSKLVLTGKPNNGKLKVCGKAVD